MQKKHKNDIIFVDGDPLLVWKSDLDELIEVREELEKSLFEYKKMRNNHHFINGCIVGFFISILIIIIVGGIYYIL